MIHFLPLRTTSGRAHEMGAPKTSKPTCLDSRDLVGRIRNAEPGATAELYRTFHAGVRLLFSRSLGAQDAEDQAHDTFVVVIEAIQRGRIQKPECLAGFIRAVVKNKIASHIRAVTEFRARHGDLECAEAKDWRGNPEEETARREMGDLMRSVLLGLPARDREVLIRFYLREQPQEQIQTEMNLAPAQFRLLKSRAKAQFGTRARLRLAGRRPVGVQGLSRLGQQRLA
jgi:RNA polymerase sigma-70 factor, ECF subfamily